MFGQTYLQAVRSYCLHGYGGVISDQNVEGITGGLVINISYRMRPFFGK